jgi:alanine dehydrogenase
VLQDTGAPLMFITGGELAAFSPGSLIIDVSCDAGMGFSWARPTSFADPVFTVGSNIHYYAVDHSPSLLWDSATWEISNALLPHLQTVLGGPAAWASDETIRRAIEIRDGIIQNPDILAFQHRAAQYPHPRLSEPFSSCDLAGLKDVDGLGELACAPGAAAEFTQDAPGFQLGVSAFTGGP